MKRSEVLRLLEKWAEDELEYIGCIGPLCIILPSCVIAKWYDYWDTIDDEGLNNIGRYYRNYSCSKFSQSINDEISLLRLLILHDFINETYEG